MYEIRRYVRQDGRDLFDDWLRRLRDVRAIVAIDRRLARAASGNFGDHKFCRDGVWELRIDLGPGYRVYYGIEDGKIILLICGGDKSSQSADISRAADCLRDWRDRSNARHKP